MDLMCNLFDKKEYDDIVKSLKNTIISGADNVGREATYRNLIKHHLSSDRAVVIVEDALTEQKHTRTSIQLDAFDRKNVKISLCERGSINVLTAFDTPEQKAGFIAALIGYCADVGESMRITAYRFYRYVFAALDLQGGSYTLADIANIGIDSAVDMVRFSPIFDTDKREREAFVSDTAVRSSLLNIGSYMVKLREYGILAALSGDDEFSHALTSSGVITVSAYEGDDAIARRILINAIASAVLSYVSRTHLSCPVSLVFSCADSVDPTLLVSLMDRSEDDVLVCAVMNDAVRYAEKNECDFIELADSFLVFKQIRESSAEYWSELFGSREVREKSYEYKKKFSLFPSKRNKGGVVERAEKVKISSVNVKKVNKPIYGPEIFKSLQDNDVMCYQREPLFRRKTRIE